MRGISRVLSKRVAFGTLVAALFPLLPSCASRVHKLVTHFQNLSQRESVYTFNARRRYDGSILR
jgi:hypothetical protein